MEADATTKARIVDLLQYKARRGQRALDFDAVPALRHASMAVVRPFRPLTPSELAHRQRMVRHLGNARS